METPTETKPEGTAPLSAADQLEHLRQQAERVKEMQAELERESDTIAEDKEDVDSRSVYVGNVDYSTTPQELQEFFKPCGNINRVNIMLNKGGTPKGFAYIEFAEPSIVSTALLLNETEFKGRQIKVMPKRTNIPGYNRGRGRGRGRGGRGFRGGYSGRARYSPY